MGKFSQPNGVTWDTDDASGNVVANPLVGYVAETFGGMALLVRVEYVTSRDQLGKEPNALQLAMTPKQAIDLAHSLLRKAGEATNQTPPQGTARN